MISVDEIDFEIKKHEDEIHKLNEMRREIVNRKQEKVMVNDKWFVVLNKVESIGRYCIMVNFRPEYVNESQIQKKSWVNDER